MKIVLELDSTREGNVAWFDTTLYCNLLSKESGVKECYTFTKAVVIYIMLGMQVQLIRGNGVGICIIKKHKGHTVFFAAGVGQNW